MKVNTLKYRLKTIENLQNAIENIAEEYNIDSKIINVQLNEHNIDLYIAGSKIQIHYGNMTYTDVIQNDNFEDVYENLDIKEYSVEELTNVIIESFTEEYKLKDE